MGDQSVSFGATDFTSAASSVASIRDFQETIKDQTTLSPIGVLVICNISALERS
jgi:hypothetical protein